MAQTVPTSFRLTASTLAQLDALADHLGLAGDRTAAVRVAVQEAVRRRLGRDAPPDAAKGERRGRKRRPSDVPSVV